MNGLWVLAAREVKRYLRQPSRLAGSLAQPLLFWLFMAAGFGDSLQVGAATDYGEFFFPGIVLMLLLFAAIFSTITLIEDRNAGFMQGVLVAPISRLSLVLGKLAGGTAIAVLQASLFMLTAPLVGMPLDPGRVPLLLLLFVVIGLGFTGMGFTVAWFMDTVAGYHAIMSTVMLPMWLLSGALFPLDGAAAWLRWVMYCNPVTYVMQVVRAAFYLPLGELVDNADLALALGVCLGWTLATVLAAVWAVRRREV